MKTMIKNELRQSKKQLMIWLGIMLILVGFCYYEYLSLKDTLEEVSQMLNTLPTLLVVMFGVKGDLNTALGWYSVIYFWTSILALVYALNLGISCVEKELRHGTYEYLFTKPVRRAEIVVSKVIASIVNIFIFAVFSGVCNYLMIILPTGGLEQPKAAFATTVGLFLTQLMLFSTGLFTTSIVKKQKSSIQISTLLLLVFYGISVIAEYTNIRLLDFISPLRYFDVYDVTLGGIQTLHLIIAGLIIAFCIAVSIYQWKNREIHK